MTGPQEADEPTIYAIRFSVQAQQDIIDAAYRLAELTQDPALAKSWADGLYDEVSRLATYPRVYPVVQRETRLFGRETRQLIYRRSPSSVAYRVLFVIVESSEESPTVTIVHVRHGGRKPPTREEARFILVNQ